MKRIIQIRSCKEVDGHVSPCPMAEAHYFGVYIGSPDNMQWAADFAYPSHAYLFAHSMSKDTGYPIHDELNKFGD